MRADVLLFGIHGTVAWWRHLGQNLGWGKSLVVTDLCGEGDFSVVKDFYTELKRMKRKPDPAFTLFTDLQISDITLRCRTLRWLDPNLAKAMIQAMAIVFDRLLDQIQPSIVLSFPIDRYVKDVAERLTNARGIKYLELTASVVPGMSMLLHRGKLVELNTQPSEGLLQQVIQQIATPSFLPSYVPQKSTYTKAKFIKILSYYRARALAFQVISRMQRDPLNVHYLDAQPYLGHKCQWKDIRIFNLCDPRWQDMLSYFPKEKRIFFGLQLFPEASIDYWISNIELIEYENLVVDAARAFSEAGFLVLVKDHPLQFGFRQTKLIDQLLALPNVVFVPYDVEGNRLLELVDMNFTCTGTLGLQAALAGKTSIVTDSYYTNEDDFILFRKREEVKVLPKRAQAERWRSFSLQERKERIVTKILRGSFAGDFFSFKDFDDKQPNLATLNLARALGQRLIQLSEKGDLCNNDYSS